MNDGEMNRHGEIQRSLGDIQGQLRTVLANQAEIALRMTDHIEKDDNRFEKHAIKIASLENQRWWDRGFAAALGAIFGFGGGHFPKL